MTDWDGCLSGEEAEWDKVEKEGTEWDKVEKEGVEWGECEPVATRVHPESDVELDEEIELLVIQGFGIEEVLEVSSEIDLDKGEPRLSVAESDIELDEEFGLSGDRSISLEEGLEISSEAVAFREPVRGIEPESDIELDEDIGIEKARAINVEEVLEVTSSVDLTKEGPKPLTPTSSIELDEDIDLDITSPPAVELTDVDWDRTGLTSCPSANETHCVAWEYVGTATGHYIRILRSTNSGAFIQVATGISLNATACSIGGLARGHSLNLSFGDNPGFNFSDDYQYRIEIREDGSDDLVDSADTSTKSSLHHDCIE